MRREGQELSDILLVSLPSHRTASAKKPLRSQCDPLLTSALYLLFLSRSRVTHWVNSPFTTLYPAGSETPNLPLDLSGTLLTHAWTPWTSELHQPISALLPSAQPHQQSN